MSSTSSPTTTRTPSTWVPHFLVLASFWGCSFALTRVGLEALNPVQVAFWRLLIGAITLAVIAVLMRARLPRRRATWMHLSVVAALLNAAPFTLFAMGQEHVSSTLAAIINAATPLVTLLVVLFAFPEEKPTLSRGLGLLTGFVGILIVLGIWRALPEGEVGGIAACLAAIACYGIAFPYARRYLHEENVAPVGLATGQVGLATLMMVGPLLITGTEVEGSITLHVGLSLLALGALSSGVAYILNFHIIAQAGATTASSVTYLTPVVAAVVGVSLLGETMAWHEPVGALVVLLGVAISQGRLTRSSNAATSVQFVRGTERAP